MYIGIGKNRNKTILDKDTFSYALERVFTNEEDRKSFCMEFVGFGLKNLQSDACLEEFKSKLIDWFYSGDWIYESEVSE